MLTVLRRFAPRNRWTLASIVVFTVLLPFVDVALPLLMGASLDGSHAAIPLLIGAALARFALQASRRFLSGVFSFHTQHRIRSQLFRAVHSVDEQRAASSGTGHVVSRSISDLNAIQVTTAMLPLLLNSVVELTLITVVVLWISPPIALLILIFAPLLIWIGKRSRTDLYQPTARVREQAATVATHVEQTVTGIQVVKSFAQEGRHATRYDRLTRALLSLNVHLAAINARFQPALAAVPNVALVATIAVGGWLALHGVISLGEFLSVATYITMLSRLARQCASMVVNLHTTQASVDRVLEVIDAPPRPTGSIIPSEALSITGTVDLGHARVPINIPAGSTTIVRGSVASGKTRLAHALAGLNSKTASTLNTQFGPLLDIREDHRPVIVMDEPFLFSASIRDNILLGLPHDPCTIDQEIRRATDIACATDFIDELGGLDTIVGERGVTLSGGQRQRIAIARAVLRRPSMIIFDDATSALDHSTEEIILSRLSSATEQNQVTVVAISHRADGGFRHPDQFLDLPNAPGGGTSEATRASDKRASSATAEQRAEDPEVPRWIQTMGVPHLPGRESTGPVPMRTLLGLAPGFIVAVAFTLLATALADISLPTFIRHALDTGVQHQHEQVLWVTAAVALAVVVFSWIAAIANTLLTSITGEKLLFALRQRMFAHLTRMDLLWFHRQASGRIMTRLTTDIESLSTFLQSGLSQAIVSTTMLLGIFGMLLATDATLSAAVAAFLPLIIGITIIFRRVSRTLYTRARNQISHVNAVFQEALMGLTTSQAYHYGPALQNTLEKQSRDYVTRRTRSQAAVSLYFPTLNTITYIAQATVLAVGASHNVSPGTLVAFSLYLSLFFSPIQQLSHVFDSYQQARVSWTRINSFLAEQPTIVSGSDPLPDLGGRPPTIRFNGVTFDYPRGDAGSASDIPLIDIDHEFRGTTAIVGHTGAGKSTIIRMVNRLIDPTHGIITVNGCNLRNISLSQWRTHVGTVPQEPHLFVGSVRSNIAFSQHDATHTDIMNAIRRINGEHILATIPGGLDGHVGEGGRGLSAGQKHIIALARAELLTPAIMLLDEATALIEDSEEQQIVDAITRASTGRTTIIIAHRLRTAARADTILVMDHGRIVEQGSHDQLISRGGQYKRLWDAAHATPDK
ncbi:ABC transporter ATP-binding protein [Corynebacterium sp. 320]|nr:ABC transporter ATP-binding protein [Corynebacterium sp. 320]KAB1552939.1 ABC transporter ATP-binding protein [Corynebacterium sp. 321]KAB1553841.1 ABC transporter ATP-binding protein [Corynebacterium sp. 319]KAB3528098.1 ABC transporter ATP-binding protein [Corynebacterium sp. 250]KAB3540414.1 ABC transporter ATP-binding protein [Corynebacterium sp. 366]QNP91641.1 ABC transporter ATP-binding protein [Corynebacterium zhongnanshanii]